MERFIKRENGITLTSLVVTIIVMLLLAGVTLSLTIGDEGVITQSMDAKEEHAKSVYKELISVELSAEKIKGTDGVAYLEGIKSRLEIKEEFEGAKYAITQGRFLTVTTKEGYVFKVEGDKVTLASDGKKPGSTGRNRWIRRNRRNAWNWR